MELCPFVKNKFALTLAAIGFIAPNSRADFVIYSLPGSGIGIVLEGNATASGRGFVTLRHKLSSETLAFKKDEVKVHFVPDAQRVLTNKLREAKHAEDAFDVALESVRRGWQEMFDKGLAKTLELDENHEEALAVSEVADELAQPIDASEDIEASTEAKTLRKYVDYDRMKLAQSDHFLILHDFKTDEKKRKAGGIPKRVQDRLDLLEQVYRSFILYFTARGQELDIPKRRLMVVFFAEEKDYLTYSRSVDPSLVGTLGFYDPIRNVAFFYDRSSEAEQKQLEEIAKRINADTDELKRMKGVNAGRAINFGRTMNIVVEIYQANADLTVVTHEATHQLAANTGLFPRHVRVPSWVHEGLATYFESPRDATWSGIGAVNKDRINWYNALAEGDRAHSNIEFIVGDQIFKYAGTHGSLLHGYGQAWALTHFLMDRHFNTFMRYYHLIASLPPDTTLAPDLLNKLFDQAFDPSKRKELDREWRDYMNQLKTDFERVVADAEEEGEEAAARGKKKRR